MSGPLLSPHWYRVASLRPRLRPHLRLYRHHYRGALWFVMHDPGSGRSHRFTPGARFILAGMDGSRDVAALWAAAQRRLGERTPTQDELIHLLGQLHAADLMQCDVTPDAAELFERSRRQQRTRARQAWGNPMSLKLPLLDPSRLLDALEPWLRPLWNRWGALAWLALVLPAALLALGHREALADDVADRLLAPANLLLLALLFPLIKVLHELGHGIAARMRGGEVHEVGVMLLVFMPVPYVDASAAAVLRSKWDRALVGAAGMAVELVLGALAMYVWLLVEPGPVRAVAFNVMLVAGVSTLVFNGNPLLRYDGYYILADLIEMPNLAARANRYVGHLVERGLFGLPDSETPAGGPGERAWLLFYALASFVYRLLVSVALVLFITGEFFVVGLLLGAWAAVTMLLLPAARTLRQLVDGPRLAPVRGRALATSAALALAAALALLAWPAPQRSHTEGVVWLPEHALVRAGGAGFLARYLVAPGTLVQAGEPLAELVDPALDAQVRVAQARADEVQARFDALFVADRAQAEQLRGPLAHARQELAELQDRAARLVAFSPGAGRFTVPQAADRPGRHLRRGDLLGYVTDPARPGDGAVVRAVVAQADADLVRSATRAVALRAAWQPERTLPGRLLHEVPAGSAELPSRALAVDGGGQVVVDPRDREGLHALERRFQFDIALPPDSAAFYGARVHVRFEHPEAPLAVQWARSLRQLLLSRFQA